MSKILIITNHSYMLYRFRLELIQELMKEHEVLLSMPFVGHEEDFQALGLRCILAEVDGGEARVGHEGIRELIWMTEEELRAKIAAGEITDGFTLSALTLLACGGER